jgi:hypothetical protein
MGVTIKSQQSWGKGLRAQAWWRQWHEEKFNRKLEDAPRDNHSPWDYRDAATGLTYEVKFDDRSAETGNLCFEVHGGDRGPTGLMVSTCDWLVYLVPCGNGQVEIHYLRRGELIRLMFGGLVNNMPLGRFVKVKWDGDALAYCWIVNKEIILEAATVRTFTGGGSDAHAQG